MKKLLIIIQLLFLAGVINSNAQTHPENGIWLAVQLPVSFSKRWQWHNDAGYRTLGLSKEALQYLYRTGVRYNFGQRWNVAAGVAFFFSRTSFSKANNEFGSEFRFWEEVGHQHLLNKNFQFQLRFRTEQRMFAATSSKENYTAYRFRLRPGFNQKLNSKWSLQLIDEYMMQEAKKKFSFDQNRLTFSGIYQFNKATQLQAGYMWLKWPNDGQHIFTFTFMKNILL